MADRQPPIAVRQATEDRPIAHPKRLIGDRKAAENRPSADWKATATADR